MVEEFQETATLRKQNARAMSRLGDKKKEIKSLKTIMPEGINAVGPTDDEWEELEIAVDSGA